MIIAHLNINSIRNKIGEVQDLLYKQLLDIYCVSETKIDESFPQGQFNVPNYTAYRYARTATSGGIITYVRSEIPSRQRQDLIPKPLDEDLELTAVEIILNKSKMILAHVYRHPNGLNQRQEQCFKHLSEFMDKALVEYEFCLLMGDFNIYVKQSRDNKNEVLYNFMDNYDMNNLIKHDTCHKSSEGTIIDLLITNDKSKFISAGTIANGASDFHEVIYGVLSAKFKHKQAKHISYRCYKNFEHENFINDLNQAPFHVAEIFEDPNDQYGYFNDLYKTILNEHAPVK